MTAFQLRDGIEKLRDSLTPASGTQGLRYGKLLDRLVKDSFYLAYGLFVASCLLQRTTLKTAFLMPTSLLCTTLQVLAFLLLVVKFVSQRLSVPGYVVAAALVVVGLVPWTNDPPSTWWLLWLALFAVCAKGVRIRYVALASLIPTAVILGTTVVAARLGLITNAMSYRGDLVRDPLGFIHPNSLGFALLSACTSVVVMRFHKNPLPSVALLGACAVVNYNVANSRTSVVIALLEIALLLVFYFVRNHTARRVIAFACFGAVVACVALSYYFMAFYDPTSPFQANLDQLMSTRISLSHMYFSIHEPQAFGFDHASFNKYFVEGQMPFMLDNGYCHLLVRFGIVPTLVFLAGLVALVWKLAYRCEWGPVLFGLTIMALYATSETLGVQVDGNYFLIAMGSYLLYPQGSPLLRPGESPAPYRSDVEPRSRHMGSHRAGTARQETR